MDIPLLTISSSSSTTPLRPRKRKMCPDAWKKNLAKAKCARGEEYVSSSSGKKVEAAKQGPPCLCKQKCFEKFKETELLRIFTCFWQLEDKNIQDAYLDGLRKIERHRPQRSHYTPRSVTFVYVVRFALLCFCPFSTFFLCPIGPSL